MDSEDYFAGLDEEVECDIEALLAKTRCYGLTGKEKRAAQQINYKSPLM